MTSRLIDDMKTDEIEAYLNERKADNRPVCFYVDKKTMQNFTEMKKQLALNVAVPPSSSQPKKYVFSAESQIKEKMQLHFRNGHPNCVQYNGIKIGSFSMSRTFAIESEFSLNDSKNYENFWLLLERHPNLFVEIDVAYTSCGANHDIKVYATTMVGDFSWFE